jgi:hypothetical protein
MNREITHQAGTVAGNTVKSFHPCHDAVTLAL